MTWLESRNPLVFIPEPWSRWVVCGWNGADGYKSWRHQKVCLEVKNCCAGIPYLLWVDCACSQLWTAVNKDDLTQLPLLFWKVLSRLIDKRLFFRKTFILKHQPCCFVCHAPRSVTWRCMFTQKTLRAATEFCTDGNSDNHPMKMLELFQNINTSAQCPLGEHRPITFKPLLCRSFLSTWAQRSFVTVTWNLLHNLSVFS